MDKITVGRELACLKNQIKKEIDCQLEQYNITMEQARLLTLLNKYDNEVVFQKDIGIYLKLSKGSISTMLSILENNGWIKRNVGIDARYREIIVTDEAKEILNKVKIVLNKVDQALIRGFSLDELSLL